MKKSLLLFLLVAVVSLTAYAQQKPCNQGTAFRGCPACGKAKRTKDQWLNTRKNRGTAATHPDKITFDELRDPDNNTGKFNETMKVWITGYVASVDPGGKQETCNCKRGDLRDVHINIVADPSEANDKSKYVVVEFTPRWEKRFGFDDSDYSAMRQAVEDKIGGKWVKFEGHLLYDYFHENAAKTTRPNQPTCTGEEGGCNWRATAWEVHPVTKYTLVNAP